MDVQTMTIISSAVIFLIVTLLLVVMLLTAKHYLLPRGKAKIEINGKKELEVNVGNSLLTSLSEEKIFLASACGGKGSCAQCRVRVT